MGRATRRFVTTAAATVSVMALAAGPALAHQCVNASKNANNPAAGAQLVLGQNGEPISMSKGLANRVEKGIVDFESGEGYHGIIAFDEDGDGEADVHTYIVGPEGEIPQTAQHNGPACKGITDLPTYFEECVG